MAVTCSLDHSDPEVIPSFLCRACNPQLNERALVTPRADGPSPTEGLDRLERRKKRQLRAEVAKWRNRVEIMERHKVSETDLAKAKETLRRAEHDLYMVA